MQTIKVEKITDPHLAYLWIMENKDKLNRKTLINALDRWAIMAGYTAMIGEDFLWCLENIK